MIVNPAGAASRMRSAPSIRSWSVMIRCVRPRLTAARINFAGLATLSKDADVWQ